MPQAKKRAPRARKPRPSPVANVRPDGSLTTEQLLERTGLARETLFSWVRKGYVEKPRVDKVPEGRGRRAMWWPHVVEHVKALRAVTARGVPIQLAFHQLITQGSFNSAYRYDEVYGFAQEWGAPASAGDLPRRLGLKNNDASLRECFVYAVASLAIMAGLDEPTRERVEWSAAEHLVPALMNLIAGHDPVLVVAPDGILTWPREALGALYGPRSQDDPDEWVDLVSGGVTSPKPHEQSPRGWFPAFTCLDLGPVLRTLWRQWGKKLALLPSLMRYEYAPVVWHRHGDEYFETDAVLVGWGHQPPAYMLDVSPDTARPIPNSRPQLSLDAAIARIRRDEDGGPGTR